MEYLTAGGFRLIGLQLDRKTFNEGGQSGRDCGSLWQQFESGDFHLKIPGKVSNEICAVYFDYEGDHTRPYSYFIGCQVNSSAEVPEGMSTIVIPEGNYTRLIAHGQMPDCVAGKWREIWDSAIERQYTYDFEVYGEKSKDWSNATVEVFISSNPPPAEPINI
jgi:predicted transcriptional regulator YdeE